MHNNKFRYQEGSNQSTGLRVCFGYDFSVRSIGGVASVASLGIGSVGTGELGVSVGIGTEGKVESVGEGGTLISGITSGSGITSCASTANLVLVTATVASIS